MSNYYPKVNPGDEFRPNADRENAINDMLAHAGTYGAIITSADAHNKVMVPVYNAYTANLIGAGASVAPCGQAENGVIPVSAAAANAPLWGVLRETLSAGEIGAMQLGGVAEIPNSWGIDGGYVVPNGIGGYRLTSYGAPVLAVGTNSNGSVVTYIQLGGGAVISTNADKYSGYWKLEVVSSEVEIKGEIAEDGNPVTSLVYFVSATNPPTVHAYRSSYYSNHNASNLVEISLSGTYDLYASYGYCNESAPIQLVTSAQYVSDFNANARVVGGVMHHVQYLGRVASGVVYQRFKSYESEQTWNSYNGSPLLYPYSDSTSGAGYVLASQYTDLGRASSFFLPEADCGSAAVGAFVCLSASYDSGYRVDWVIRSSYAASSSYQQPIILVGRMGIDLARPAEIAFMERWIVADVTSDTAEEDNE